MGDRPNVNPPVIFDSGLSQQEPVGTAEQLIRAMEGGSNRIEEGQEEWEDRRGKRGSGFELGEIGGRGERQERRKDELENIYGEEEEGESSVRGGMGDENDVPVTEVSIWAGRGWEERK